MSEPTIAEHIAWLRESLSEHFIPGEPVNGDILNVLVTHLREVERLVGLVDRELALHKALQPAEETETLRARIHKQPGRMQ